MKRAYRLLLAGLLLMPSGTAAGAVYEASTLHNAVSRSETVQDLFLRRWDEIFDRELFLDLFGKINYINNFKVNTLNKGTGKKEPVDMTLVRTYGSISFAYPVLTGYSAADIALRLIPDSAKIKPDGREEIPPPDQGLWQAKRLVAGFTATGFHYGLMRKVEIDRGPAGHETSSDYKYSQFFDDLFALTVVYRPWFYVHAGIIVSNQIEPNDDGTMDYGNSSHMSFRYFTASNFFTFLNMNTTARGNRLEALAVGIRVNDLAAIFAGKINPLVPELTVTGRMVKLFNDEPWDAVWVDSATAAGGQPKDSSLPGGLKEHAKLYTLSLLVKETLRSFSITLYTEFQGAGDTLIEKRTITPASPAGDKLDLHPLRMAFLMMGYEFAGSRNNSMEVTSFMLSAGASRFWDAAVPLHRESGERYSVYGWIFSIDFKSFYWGIPYGMNFRFSRNYASDLNMLVEAADKFIFEGSLCVSF